MAIYHVQVTIISTAKGRCAVASSAYRRRAVMVQHATGQMFDYRAWEPIAHAELSLPHDTPAWFRKAIDGLGSDASAEALWNAVEAKEGQKGTGLAMVMDIALPIELDGSQGLALARDWIESEVVAKGFAVDWTVRLNETNPHFHVMIPLRRLTEKGFARKQEFLRDEAGNVVFRDDGKPRYERMAGPMKEFIAWRRSWAETANHHLKAAGHDARIDHRSHAEAGIERKPGKHLGPVGSQIAARKKRQQA